MADYAYAIGVDLSPEEIPLERIFLDPNNPRFVGSSWEAVPDSKVTEEAVQEQAARRLIEKFDIDKLRSNMEINGYLPIDRVVVKRVDDDAYVVLEGNRRICAAKELVRVSARDESIPDDVRESAEVIPCLVYSGDDSMAAWTFQGLRHITGINDWPAFNKAKLLVNQMEEEDINLTEAGKRFGLSAYGAGQWVRGYYAFLQAGEETDYGSEVDERCYPFFQELFGRSSIPFREWLDWDDDNYEFRNKLRLNEFVGWLYPKPDNEEADGTQGIWDDRRLVVRDDLRKISYVLRQNRDVFEEFRRNELELESAYAKILTIQYEKSADREEEVFEAVQACAKSLGDLPFKMLVNEETSRKLFEALEGLKSSIEAIEQAKR